MDGQTIEGEDVVSDDVMSGTITPVALGPLANSSDVTAYHVLANGDRLLAIDVTVSLPGGVTAKTGDVVRYDGANYTIEFDAASESIPSGVKIDAVSVNTAGNLVLSFDTSVATPGGAFNDEDVLKYNPGGAPGRWPGMPRSNEWSG